MNTEFIDHQNQIFFLNTCKLCQYFCKNVHVCIFVLSSHYEGYVRISVIAVAYIYLYDMYLNGHKWMCEKYFMPQTQEGARGITITVSPFNIILQITWVLSFSKHLKLWEKDYMYFHSIHCFPNYCHPYCSRYSVDYIEKLQLFKM